STFCYLCVSIFFFFSSRRRHTRFKCDWSSDVCSSDLSETSAWKEWLTVAVSVIVVRWPMRSMVGRDRRYSAAAAPIKASGQQDRSEERRVGKECRTRGWGCE